MNATQKNDIRIRLLEERERILEEWKNHGGDAGPGEDWDLRDPEERAVQATSTAVEQRIAGDDLNLLRKVDFALQRLDDGSYEHCARCGSVISIDRLIAKPSVSLCIACQELKDAAKC
jgi:DnaK suppressor protein